MWGITEVTYKFEEDLWDEHELTFREFVTELGYDDAIALEDLGPKIKHRVWALKHRDYFRDKYVSPVFATTKIDGGYETILVDPDAPRINFEADFTEEE